MSAAHNGFPILQSEEAAESISNGMTLGIGGFTDPGCPHAVPLALAARARRLHAQDQPFAVRVLSGAEAGPAVDQELAEAGAVCFRTPYQAEKASRSGLNAGLIDYVDVHLSHVAQQLTEGIFGTIDMAIVEATAVSPTGRIHFSTAIGNGPTILKLAGKVILELNSRHPSCVGDLADIALIPPPPHRDPIPIHHVLDRIGQPFIEIDPAKILGVVPTSEKSTRAAPRPANAVTQRIAGHIIRFFLDEIAAGRLPREFLPLQAGVGNVSNAVMAELGQHTELPPFSMYTEVFQDSCLDLMRAGRMAGASSSSLTLSEDKLQELYDNWDFFSPRIVLRPSEISNHPTVIRQLGVICINVALEADIYGHVNSTHVCGTQMMNGIGGSGDFERNGYLTIFATPSVAKNGAISAIVPFCSHIDHSEHSVHVLVTEQGLADLRGTGPAERARRIIDRCAHPAYRDYLHEYVRRSRPGHIRHDLARCFELHRNLMEQGAMLPGLKIEAFA
jgi:acetyl-CoA hydrolase